MVDAAHFQAPALSIRFRGLARDVLFTDGAKYVADEAGINWLLDEIALSQMNKRVAAEEFQLWKLKLSPLITP